MSIGANPSVGINRPSGEMIEGKAAKNRRVMAEHTARAADEHRWAIFEAEALPHVDRLFRLAMWFERDRSEAEDLVQETMLQALNRSTASRPAPTVTPGSRRFSSTCGATGVARATGRFSSRIPTTVWRS